MVSGTDAGPSSALGFSVGLSGDGNTAIVGGPGDNSNTGAAWVFTRSNGLWAQQGSKLVGTGAQQGDNQGWSVALSADGSTAIVGSPGANNNSGAAWIYTFRNRGWKEERMLTGDVGSKFGFAVALSYDGSTAIVGAPSDGSGNGAAWVFTRNNGVWSQLGSKLVNAVRGQGASVAVSADGSTVVVGGEAASVYTYNNDLWTQQASLGATSTDFSDVALSADGNTVIESGFSGAGSLTLPAAWVFTHSGGSWAEPGSALNSPWPAGGGAVGLSADGYTAIVSGEGNSAATGSPVTVAVVFTSSNGAWTSLGTPLVGHLIAQAGLAAPQLRAAVALSGDGNTAIVGATGENSGAGAVWVCVRPVVTITASPNPVPMGESTQLSWTSSDTTACEAANDWIGSKRPRIGSGKQLAINGGVKVWPPITRTPKPMETFDYYMIKCRNGGASATNQVVVQVDPPFQRPGVIAVCNLVCFHSLYGDPTGQGENPVKADVLLERMDHAAGKLGPFAPFAEVQSKLKGPVLLLQSGAIESLQIGPGSRQPGAASAVTVTLSPGSKVIKLGELGANVRIAEAAAGSAKPHIPAASPASTKLRIVGINFNDGTPSGLLIAHEGSPPEASRAK